MSGLYNYLSKGMTPIVHQQKSGVWVQIIQLESGVWKEIYNSEL